MQFEFHNYSAFEVEQSIKGGLLKKFKLADTLTAQRIALAVSEAEKMPDKDLFEKENYHWKESWKEWWSTLQMCLLENLEAGYQKDGYDLNCGSIKKDIYESAFMKMGLTKEVLTKVRKGKDKPFVRFQIKPDHPCFKELPEKVNKITTMIGPGVLGELYTRQRYTKMILDLNVATCTVEANWEMECEVFDYEKNDWVPTM